MAPSLPDQVLKHFGFIPHSCDACARFVLDLGKIKSNLPHTVIPYSRVQNDVWSTLEECKFWTWCLKPILRPSTTFPARTYWPVDDDVDRSQTLLDVLAVQTHGKVDELRIGWYNPDEIHLDGSLAVDEDCILSASSKTLFPMSHL